MHPSNLNLFALTFVVKRWNESLCHYVWSSFTWPCHHLVSFVDQGQAHLMVKSFASTHSFMLCTPQEQPFCCCAESKLHVDCHHFVMLQTQTEFKMVTTQCKLHNRTKSQTIKLRLDLKKLSCWESKTQALCSLCTILRCKVATNSWQWHCSWQRLDLFSHRELDDCSVELWGVHVH